MKSVITAVNLAFCLWMTSPANAQVFSSNESTYVVNLTVDMSGSFSNQMAEKGEAFAFVKGLIERYFRARVGTADRLIISQISGNDEALVWEGLPLQLRKQHTPETFGRFLRTNSDPSGGSRVYDSIADSIEYLMEDPAVASGQAKSAVLICSDMWDTTGSVESEQRLLTALAKYGRAGGVVGIYYCDQRLVGTWRRRLRDAGIRQYCVESEIVGRPTFPKFED